MSILSIQSHVSFGHVGNAAAVFILRRMGFDVWPVHTVLFSNHPGYGDFGGEVVASAIIEDILRGLEKRSLFADCKAVIGGYLGSAETGHAMIGCVRKIKNMNAGTVFYLDPVIGDRDSGVYVHDDIVSFYRDHGLRSADIIKCNAFELEVLSFREVRDVTSAIAAARSLMDATDARTVVVTSIPGDPDDSECALATAAITVDGTWVVSTPVIPVEQKGAGDAFMALFVANDLLVANQTGVALSRAVSSIWGLMRETCNIGGGELHLIAAQQQLLVPQISYDAHWIG